MGNRHVEVIRLPDGAWAVQDEDGKPPVSVHPCQSTAQVEALKLARERGQLVIVCDQTSALAR